MKDEFIEKVKVDSADKAQDSTVVDTATSSILIDTLVVDSTIIDSIEIDEMSQDSLDKNYKSQDDIEDFMTGMLDVPERVIKWLEIFGYIGLLFSGLYILGGLFLIIIKKFSIKLAYVVLGGNILFSLLKWIVLSGDDVKGFVAFSTGISQAIGMFFGIILLVVIVSCDQSEYEDDVYTD